MLEGERSQPTGTEFFLFNIMTFLHYHTRSLIPKIDELSAFYALHYSGVGCVVELAQSRCGRL